MKREIKSEQEPNEIKVRLQALAKKMETANSKSAPLETSAIEDIYIKARKMYMSIEKKIEEKLKT
jgi:hypothetical protein